MELGWTAEVWADAVADIDIEAGLAFEDVTPADAAAVMEDNGGGLYAELS